VNPLARHFPNALSAARLALAAAVPWLGPGGRVAAVAAAAVTDVLDGYLARRWGTPSALGRLLDPLADKAFVLVLLGTLLAEGAVPAGWAAGLAARDAVVLAGAGWVAARGRWRAYPRMAPTWLGKATTAAQFAVLLVAAGQGSAPGWLLGPTAALSAAAAADYARRFAAGREPPPPGGAGPRA
jgi:phosphatidylglycerophosphate synthase